MQGLRVGHYTKKDDHTGLSVFLFDEPAIGAYWLCGSAPATHEMMVLDPEATVTHIDALVFMGGSALGLSAVRGVQRFLSEQKKGWVVPHGTIPIVPAAAIYDLAVGKPHPPTEEDAYEACVHAKELDVGRGRIGAGRGASVGKLVPHTARMSGGLGRAETKLSNGVTVIAYAVVNSVGDVRDLSQNIMAGARLPNGHFANCEKYISEGGEPIEAYLANTTLVAIFTDASFSKMELKRIAKMAAAGLGRAIAPIFTRYDGDIVFCISLGDKSASELTVGTVAASLVQLAIIDAVKDSVIL